VAVLQQLPYLDPQPDQAAGQRSGQGERDEREGRPARRKRARAPASIALTSPGPRAWRWLEEGEQATSTVTH
jgi:hypothetical protein